MNYTNENYMTYPNLVALLVLILFVVVLALVRRSKRKKKEEDKLNKAIVEYKRLIQELEYVDQLCMQELMKAKKIKEKMMHTQTRQDIDFSNFEQLKAEFMSKESLREEMKIGWELVKKNMNNKKTATRALASINDQMNDQMEESESLLKNLREENKRLMRIS